MAENNKPTFFDTTTSIIGPKAMSVIEKLYAFQDYIIANAVKGDTGATGKGIKSVEFVQYKETNTIGEFKIIYDDDSEQLIDIPISTNQQIVKNFKYENSETPTSGDFDFDFDKITSLTISCEYLNFVGIGTLVKQGRAYNTAIIPLLDSDFAPANKVLIFNLATGTKAIYLKDENTDVTLQCKVYINALVQGIN